MKKTLIVFASLLVMSSLIGCKSMTIGSSIYDKKRCTLGCGKFKFIKDGNQIMAVTVGENLLAVPRIINERPVKNGENNEKQTSKK
jgi:hypothetical protein